MKRARYAALMVLLLAWPAAAQWFGGGWQGAQGSITAPTPQPTFSYVPPTPDPRIPPTPVATATAAPTATAQPAPTAVSTATPQPTATVVSTATPQPTPTTIVPITESQVTDLPSHLADLAAGQAGSGSPGNVGSALGQGCGIALRSTSAYTFDLPQCTFTVQGVTYTAPLTTGVTLAAAHATLDRVDIAVANVGSPATQSIITGTPATNPSEPPYDGLTQLRIGSITVTHNTTAPVGATNETIFDEGVAEWTPTTGTGWSCSDTTNPQNGTKDCKATAVAANAFTKFVRGSTLSLTGYQQLNAYFYPVGASTWGSKRSAVLTFRDANDVQLGQPVIITDKSYGFSTSSTTKQLLVIPTAQFAIPTTAVVKAFRIDPQGTGGTFSFYVDNVVLQSTTNSTPIQGITMDQALATFLRFTPTPVSTATPQSTATAAPTATPPVNISYAGSLNITGATAISASATPAPGDRIIDCTSGSSADQTYTLPAATGTGRILDFYKVDSGTKNCIISRAGSDAVNSGTTRTLSAQWKHDTCRDKASALWICVGDGT